MVWVLAEMTLRLLQRGPRPALSSVTEVLPGLPWWPSGESARPYRRQGFDLWSGRIPRTLTPETLSPCAPSLRAQDPTLSPEPRCPDC